MKNNIDLQPNKDPLVPPKNESNLHFFLKQVGQAYLRINYKCRYIGTEVYVGKSIDYSIERKHKDLPFNEKKITDVIGVEDKKLKYMDHKGIIRNIEVKVSKSDFQSGYTIMGDYNYIMAPKGVLDKSDIPSMIGLLEVDMDKLKVVTNRSGIFIHGVDLVTYPTRLKQKKYIAKSHKNYVQYIKDNISYKNTNRNVYKNLWFYWDD